MCRPHRKCETQKGPGMHIRRTSEREVVTSSKDDAFRGTRGGTRGQAVHLSLANAGYM